MHPAALVFCTLIVCATVLAVAWLLRVPRMDQARLEELVEQARGAMERTFAKALDEAAEIGETIKRHRARIDGATRGNPRGAEPPAPQRTLFDLTREEVSQLPREQQLEWLAARRRAAH